MTCKEQRAYLDKVLAEKKIYPQKAKLELILNYETIATTCNKRFPHASIIKPLKTTFYILTIPLLVADVQSFSISG